MAGLFTIITLALAAAATPLSTSHSTLLRQSRHEFAPLMNPDPTATVVKDGYIVVFKDGISTEQFFAHIDSVNRHPDSLMQADGGLKHVYDLDGFKGYAGSFKQETVDLLRAQPEVDYIEKDTVVHALDTQIGAPWGLARISHRNKLTLGTFTKYEYDRNGGEGVNVYVIDTGIYVDHAEFEGRASWGHTMPRNDVDEDGNGHGTHCAGTIASKSYGVAKKAHVIAVKVLGSNGSGTNSDVIGGVQWALNDANAHKKAAMEELRTTGKTKYKGSVANMSLGGGRSPSLDRAVNAAVLGGMHFAVAAGNDNRDACTSSPAAAELPVTVGASTLGDERAYFSNYGSCVDIFAPGLDIKSTWNTPGGINVISGTSMASPHTAGMIAYLLSLYPSKTFNPEISKKSSSFTTSESYQALISFARTTFPGWMTYLLPRPEANFAPIPGPELTPAIMKKALIALSSKDKLDDLPDDTVNYLIYNNATALKSSEEFWASLFV